MIVIRLSHIYFTSLYEGKLIITLYFKQNKVKISSKSLLFNTEKFTFDLISENNIIYINNLKKWNTFTELKKVYELQNAWDYKSDQLLDDM